MKAAVVSFTDSGSCLNARIRQWMSASDIECENWAVSAYAAQYGLSPLQERTGEWAKTHFDICDALIFVGAAGIAVRSIAPLLRDKMTDPAVLVIDEKGQFVIPILSGHVGGANALAVQLAKWLGGQAVLTTATDVQGRFAVDVWAASNHLLITDRTKAKRMSAAILNGQKMRFYSDADVVVQGVLPEELIMEPDRRKADLVVSDHMEADQGLVLILHKRVWIGIGCRRDTPCELLEQGMTVFMHENNLTADRLAGIASVDVKAKEQGIVSLCQAMQLPFVTFSAEILSAVKGSFTTSAFVNAAIGVDNVCERAAVCASGGAECLIKKTIYPKMTLAAAEEPKRVRF